ncbi:MAG: HupE/UreJ family protein [Verrucomicrobia bacterium]|nr:HupE/UreJ family protein [Verrucomicrobiota bacterium]
MESTPTPGSGPWTNPLEHCPRTRRLVPRTGHLRHSLGLFLLSFWLLSLAQAHTASTAYLQVSAMSDRISGRLELPLRDLEDRFGLDTNEDGQLTWGEFRRRGAEIEAWVRRGLVWSSGTNALPWTTAEWQVSQRQDEGYAVLDFQVNEVAEVQLTYGLLWDQDPLHRCLVFWNAASRPGQVLALSPTDRTWSVPAPGATTSAGWLTLVREGVHHIWTGYDHLLFLLALLLPAVLRRTPTGWAPVGDLGSALRDVIKVVTAFTVAHSLTLILVTLGWVSLPSRWVEVTIAGSIGVAAFANFRGRPRLGDSGIREILTSPWAVAFLFGLIHGFGFAGVLTELELPPGHLAGPLLGFNLGVELGQLACVLVFVPLAFALRATWFYRQGVLPVGSALILLMAAGWVVERSFGLGFMPL